jgi:hypothetical protein
MAYPSLFQLRHQSFQLHLLLLSPVANELVRTLVSAQLPTLIAKVCLTLSYSSQVWRMFEYRHAAP